MSVIWDIAFLCSLVITIEILLNSLITIKTFSTKKRVHYVDEQ